MSEQPEATTDEERAAWDRPPTRTAGDLWAIGADGAPGGWLAALGYGRGTELHRVEVRLVADFEALVALRGDLSDVPVCVDVPMGLPDRAGYRPCDVAARDLLGRQRQSSVFAPPSRDILDTETYAEARAILNAARETDVAARSMSAQSYGIVPKVRDADRYLQSHREATEWLWEVHPEVCFLGLNHDRPLDGKRTPGGQARRIALLDPLVPGMLEALGRMRITGKQADMTDALDALVAMETALRVREGRYRQLGDERDSTGLPMRMVF